MGRFLHPFLWWLMLVSGFGAKAGQPANLQFRHFDAGTPLSGNAVYSIAQDHEGFLWFGTYKGLYRYDGYNFLSFQNDTGALGMLAKGPCYKVIMDHNHKLWAIILDIGVFCFDPQSLKISQVIYNHDYDTASPVRSTVTDIGEDKWHNIWITTRGDGLFEWEASSASLKRYNNDPLAPRSIKEAFECLLCTPDGEIWLGHTMLGLYRFNTVTKHLEPYRVPGLANVPVYCIKKKEGALFISYKSGLMKMEYNINGLLKYEEKAVPGEYRCSLKEDGFIWLGTSKQGLGLIDENTGTVKFYHTDPSAHNALISNKIWNIVKDNTGNLWIATDNGACVISRLQPFVSTLTSNELSGKDMPDLHIKSIVQDGKENLWVGTLGDGFYRYTNGSSKRFAIAQIPDNETYQKVYDVVESQKGTILIGGAFGVEEFDPVKEKMVKCYYPNDYSIFAWSIMEDRQHNLWIGTNRNGLYIYNEARTSWRQYLGYDKYKKKAYSIWAMKQDADGSVWLGTDKGLVCARMRGSEVFFETFPYGTNEVKGLRGKNILDIYDDGRGVLWLATSEGGLSRFDKQKKTFTAYTTANGLISNTVCSILADPDGMLWLSTEDGICVFDPFGLKIKYSFNNNNGLLTNQFGFRSRFKAKDGTMYFGNTSGINSFNPEIIKQAVNGVPVSEAGLSIISFKTLYASYTTAAATLQNIILPYKENTFFIDFAFMDFTNPLQNQYTFKMVGGDNKWYEAGNHNYTSFTNLSPGDYTFLLKGRGLNGTWSTKVLSLHITIKPPFWRTWWFISLMVLAALGILAFFAIAYLRSREAKRRQLKLELAALRAQLNPHFIFNSLTVLENFIMGEDKRKAVKYLAQFSRLMRMILENSRRETITLENEMKFLGIYLFMETARAGNSFTYEVSADDNVPVSTIDIPPMMIQPFIENAIIHGLVAQKPSGHIIVRFSLSENFLYCSIEDNGIGREAAARNRQQFSTVTNRESVGIKIITERLNLLSSNAEKAKITVTDLKDAHGLASGTRIEMMIPRHTKTPKDHAEDRDH